MASEWLARHQAEAKWVAVFFVIAQRACLRKFSPRFRAGAETLFFSNTAARGADVDRRHEAGPTRALQSRAARRGCPCPDKDQQQARQRARRPRAREAGESEAGAPGVPVLSALNDVA